MYNCFVLEQKHKVVKKHASIAFNLTGFEETVLRDILNDQMHSLRTPCVFRTDLFLEDEHPCVDEELKLQIQVLFPGVQVNKVAWGFVAYKSGARSSKGDFVFVQEDDQTVVAKILFHFKLQPVPTGTSGLFWEFWHRYRENTNHRT